MRKILNAQQKVRQRPQNNGITVLLVLSSTAAAGHSHPSGGPMNTRTTLLLLAAALAHAAHAQPRQGIDGTDLLLAQQAALRDTRPTPNPVA